MLESYFKSLGPAGGGQIVGYACCMCVQGVSNHVGAGHVKPWRVFRESSG